MYQNHNVDDNNINSIPTAVSGTARNWCNQATLVLYYLIENWQLAITGYYSEILMRITRPNCSTGQKRCAHKTRNAICVIVWTLFTETEGNDSWKLQHTGWGIERHCKVSPRIMHNYINSINLTVLVSAAPSLVKDWNSNTSMEQFTSRRGF